MADMISGWTWLNEPASWTAGDDTVTVTTDPDTDLWRTTHYGFVRDTGHVYGAPAAGDLTLTATFGGDYREQYDQAGIVLRIDEHHWIKSGIELVDGHQQISAVVTREYSDWSVAPVKNPRSVTIKADRTGDTVTISYGLDGAEPDTLLRLAYLPPDRPVRAGVMAASPTGRGFTATFTNVGLTPRG
jgi:regulation of enolase protein 1 (concanavalin A-like superfamily)